MLLSLASFEYSLSQNLQLSQHLLLNCSDLTDPWGQLSLTALCGFAARCAAPS